MRTVRGVGIVLHRGQSSSYRFIRDHRIADVVSALHDDPACRLIVCILVDVSVDIHKATLLEPN